MTYYTSFYCECPATEVEFQLEIIFSCAEEEEKELFWGYPVAVPASNEIDIIEVFKDGELWTNYPDSITNKIHDEEWTSCQYATPRKGQRIITKSNPEGLHSSAYGAKNLIPCKKRLAA